MEIGAIDHGGLLIDQVVIETVDRPSSQSSPFAIFLYALSFFSYSQFRGFKYVVLFLEDLSMYQYDDRSYE